MSGRVQMKALAGLSDARGLYMGLAMVGSTGAQLVACGAGLASGLYLSQGARRVPPSMTGRRIAMQKGRMHPFHRLNCSSSGAQCACMVPMVHRGGV